MGIYETIMRAAVADLVEPEARAYAYGIYGLIFGASWMVGNIILGFLYNYGPAATAVYTVILEAVSITILIMLLARK